MKSKSRAKAKCSKQSNTKQTTESPALAKIGPSFGIKDNRTTAAPPENSPAAGMMSMLNNAQNTQIMGGSFIVANNVNTNTASSLDVLYRRVAPNAILNAGGRADEVRCHPGTREEVIDRIEKWGDAQDDQAAPIFWLSGPAGAGKSAIVQTVAERCKQRGVPHANFFFFRGDTSRSHAPPFIATLLHQILLLYPVLRDPVASVLSINPLLFDSTLDDQLEQLIVAPLRSLPQSPSTYRPLLLLIDGLDECDSETKRSQEQILRGFDAVLARYTATCPFRLLVASRDESQIQVAFNKLSSQPICLYLNDEYSPEDDIRLFVNDQFKEVRKTHRLRHTLDSTWPSIDDVNYIVEKSSGQFIYAAVVMRFIAGSSASPVLSLERVRAVTHASTKSPFSQLDTIYTYILSNANDQDVLKIILSTRLLCSAVQDSLAGYYQLKFPLLEVLRYLNQTYTRAIILSCLEDLTPLMQYESDSGELLFYHASFSDYLLDQLRSREYSVDTAALSYKILPEALRADNRGVHDDELWALLFNLGAISLLQELPPGIMSMLISFLRRMQRQIVLSEQLFSIFIKLNHLCTCNSDVANFRLVMRLCFNKDNTANRKFDGIGNVPFGDRYFQMARADLGVMPDTEMFAALRPNSDFDRQESASWLKELSRSEVYSCDIDARLRDEYLTKWRSWAASNDIELDDLSGA